MTTCELIDVKERLQERAVLDVLTHCVYMPTEQKLSQLAAAYQNNDAVCAYALEDCGVLGVIVIERLGDGAGEIKGIAVDASRRMSGIGRQLIEQSTDRLGLTTLEAETDDDAVDFYRNCGFVIEDLGMKYPKIRRYRCLLQRG